MEVSSQDEHLYFFEFLLDLFFIDKIIMKLKMISLK